MGPKVSEFRHELLVFKEVRSKKASYVDDMKLFKSVRRQENDKSFGDR